MPTTADYPARQTLRLSTYKTQIPGLYLGDTALVGSLFLHILNETREVAKFLHSWRETHHAALLPPPSHLLRQTCFFFNRSARRWQIQRQRFCTTEKLSTTTSGLSVLSSVLIVCVYVRIHERLYDVIITYTICLGSFPGHKSRSLGPARLHSSSDTGYRLHCYGALSTATLQSVGEVQVLC